LPRSTSINPWNDCAPLLSVLQTLVRPNFLLVSVYAPSLGFPPPFLFSTSWVFILHAHGMCYCPFSSLLRGSRSIRSLFHECFSPPLFPIPSHVSGHYGVSPVPLLVSQRTPNLSSTAVLDCRNLVFCCFSSFPFFLYELRLTSFCFSETDRMTFKIRATTR